MAKVRYYYNTETCKYEPIKVTRKAMFWNFIGFMSISFILALGIIYVYRSNFTPIKESVLRTKNEQLKVDWAILNENLQSAYKHVEELEFKDDHIYRVILDTDPIPTTIRSGGSGGHDRYEALSKSALSDPDRIIGT